MKRSSPGPSTSLSTSGATTVLPTSTAAGADGRVAGSVFSECTVAVIVSKRLPSEAATKIYRVAKSWGASVMTPNPDDGLLPDVRECTHIVAMDTDFPQYQQALDGMVSIVAPDWIRYSVSRKRALNPRPYSPDPRHFLRTVTAYFADGIDQNDRAQLDRMLFHMGGQVASSMTRAVSHIISREAGKLVADANALLAAKPGGKCTTVHPRWITDCFLVGQKLDTESYGLTPSEYPTDLPARSVDVLANKRVFISDDNKLCDEVQQTIEKLVIRNGGSISKKDADIYLYRYRTDTHPFDSITGTLEGPQVGNLNWILHLASYNRLSSSLSNLLFYPAPTEGIPGFKSLQICLSNYIGDARHYLEQLISAAGAQFTRNMSCENSHLIAHTNTGDKCTAAGQFGVKLVNHRWLEESYIQERRLDEDSPRFQEYPVLSLDHLVGQIKLESDILVKQSQERASSKRRTVLPSSVQESSDGQPQTLSGSIPHPPSSPPIIPAAKKKATRKAKNSEAVSFEETRKPSKKTAVNTKSSPEPSFMTPKKSQITTTYGNSSSRKGTSRSKVSDEPVEETPEPKKLQSRSTKAAKAAVPDVKLSLDSMVDVEPSPIAVDHTIKDKKPPSGRTAKTKALKKVSAQAADMNLFETEKRRKSGVAIPGAENAEPSSEKRSRAPPAKRKLSKQAEGDEADGESDGSISRLVPKRGPVTASKRAKTTGTSDGSSIVYRVLPTMFDRWTQQPHLMKTDKMTLRAAGISILSTAPTVGPISTPIQAHSLPEDLETRVTEQSFLLCAPRVAGTKKFACALAAAPAAVVTPDFLLACLKTGERPDPADFLLPQESESAKKRSDDSGNTEHDHAQGVILETTLQRARINRRRLLKGLQIFCTSAVRGGWETCRDIVAANGGDCREYAGREELRVTRRAVASVHGGSSPEDASDLDADAASSSFERPGKAEKAKEKSGSDSPLAGSRGSTTSEADHTHDNAVYLLSSPSAPGSAEQELWKKFHKLAENVKMDARICTVDWLMHVAMNQQLVWGDRWNLEADGSRPS